MRRNVMTAALLAAALFAGAERAQAQSWTAFHGCWRGTAADAAQLVCVLPGADATTARFVTLAGGAVESETVVRADNVERPFDEGGCTGTHSAFFSQDQRRVFTRADLDCAGTKRVSTGVMALVTEQEWLDAQAVTVSGQHGARTMRYRAVSRADLPAAIAAQLPADRRMAEEAARIHATAPLDVASVVEASRVLAPPAVEALLAARNHGFDLDARALLQLKEQRVPESTIDVMVALSYPQRFAVRERSSEPARVTGIDRAYDSWYRDCYDPFSSMRRFNRYDRCYDAYGFNYYRQGRYGFGYSPWGYDDIGWRYNDPIIVIVDPREENNGSIGGSVTRGGYTRGTVGSSGTGEPRSSVTGSSSSGGSAASSAGSSTGSSSTGTSTGRTAKPRGGG